MKPPRNGTKLYFAMPEDLVNLPELHEWLADWRQAAQQAQQAANKLAEQEPPQTLYEKQGDKINDS